MATYKYGEPTVTVGQLRELLANFEPDTQVVIGHDDGWFRNVTVIHAPCEMDEYACVTSETGSDFNTYQA